MHGKTALSFESAFMKMPQPFCEISKNTFFTEHLWTTGSLKLSYHVTSGTLICIGIISETCD